MLYLVIIGMNNGLYSTKSNIEEVKKGKNLFDISEKYMTHESIQSSFNIKFKTDSELLKFHGGQGCPRVAMDEHNGDIKRASSVEFLYKNIFDELLSLEVMKALG